MIFRCVKILTISQMLTIPPCCGNRDFCSHAVVYAVRTMRKCGQLDKYMTVRELGMETTIRKAYMMEALFLPVAWMVLTAPLLSLCSFWYLTELRGLRTTAAIVRSTALTAVISLGPVLIAFRDDLLSDARQTYVEQTLLSPTPAGVAMRAISVANGGHHCGLGDGTLRAPYWKQFSLSNWREWLSILAPNIVEQQKPPRVPFDSDV